MTRRLHRLVDALTPGDRVFAAGMSGESALLADELQQDPDRARDVRFVSVQFPGIDRNDYLSAHPTSRLTAFFMSPSVRRGLAEGRAELMSADYAGIANLLRNGPLVDVAIAQVSQPDSDGLCSPGLASDFLPLVWQRARRRLVHVNPALPRTRGSFRVALSDADGWVEADRLPLTYCEPGAGPIDVDIARHAAKLIQDGDTLQFGIGTVPLALGQELGGHRRLRVHAGMVTPVVQRLVEAGAIDPAARITTGVALGDAGFYDFVGRHEHLWFTDVTHTHDVSAIARTPRFVAVNSAVEVDLFGQVNSERASRALLAGSGGLPTFAQGALASPGGRLLICLRSTAQRGMVSRIVPSLDAGGACTLPRYMADAVVTENGVAEVRGLGLEARAQALIGIAAPEHRAGLEAAWSRIRSGL